MDKKIIKQEDIKKILDVCYEKCLNGIPNVSDKVSTVALEYLNKYPTTEEACKAMLNNQVIKCGASGFLTGFGGFFTMPVALPANVTSVIYVQMRMIACAAYMNGYDLDDDEVQTFIYACLAGVALNGALKKIGIKIGEKIATQAIKKIPGKILTKINQTVGTRLITKFGTKGIINLGKGVPIVGAVVGATLDIAETKIIANRAYKWFVDNNFDVEYKNEEDENESRIIIDAEDLVV